MNNKKHDIEGLFSSKLKNFEMDVPDSVWSQLSSKLSAGEEVAYIPPRNFRKRKMVLWTLAAASVVLLLLVVKFYPTADENIVSQSGGGKNATLAKRVESSASIDQSAGSEVNENKSAGARFAHNSVPNRRKTVHPVSGTIEIPCHNLPEENQLVAEECPDKEPVNPAAPADENLQKKTEDFSNAAKDMTDRLFAQNEPAGKEKREASFGKGLAVIAGAGLGMSSQTNSANQILTLNTYAAAESMTKVGYANEGYQMLSSSTSNYQLEHSWPVSFNLGISKPLNDYLNLEVGLSFSYLYSKQKGESNASMRQSQQFNYIGLPVGLNFRVATWNRFRLGVLFGGSIQKDISGHFKEEIKSSSSYQTYSSSSIHQNKLQPSINANLHISYSVAKNINLFGKLGGAYYFDMNDKYNTIYSDKHFLPDVGVGLSYSFDH